MGNFWYSNWLKIKKNSEILGMGNFTYSNYFKITEFMNMNFVELRHDLRTRKEIIIVEIHSQTVSLETQACWTNIC